MSMRLEVTLRCDWTQHVGISNNIADNTFRVLTMARRHLKFGAIESGHYLLGVDDDQMFNDLRCEFGMSRLRSRVEADALDVIIRPGLAASLGRDWVAQCRCTDVSVTGLK
jgi:hypothetical protein